eukprot:2368103-Amphidinium_carterae.1
MLRPYPTLNKAYSCSIDHGLVLIDIFASVATPRWQRHPSLSNVQSDVMYTALMSPKGAKQSRLSRRLNVIWDRMQSLAAKQLTHPHVSKSIGHRRPAESLVSVGQTQMNGQHHVSTADTILCTAILKEQGSSRTHTCSVPGCDAADLNSSALTCPNNEQSLFQ